MDVALCLQSVSVLYAYFAHASEPHNSMGPVPLETTLYYTAKLAIKCTGT